MIPMKAISLFSGAGGDTLGMLNAGIEVVGYVEFEKNAISTHSHNFPECKLIGTDITKIPDETFQLYSGIDIIFGGFPCQSFSHGGKKDNTDKRGFLYKEFVRCASIIKPKIIIGENVKGLLTRKMDNGTPFITQITTEFQELGYTINYHLFNMKDYGLPQDRQRVIIYGIRNDIEKHFHLNLVPKEPCKYNKDILENSLEKALLISDETIKKLIPKNSYLSLPHSIDPVGTPPTNLVKCYEKQELSFKKRSKPTFGCIIDKNDVARTILSTYSRMPRLFVPVKKQQEYYLRPYTILELQRIQGFPDTFVFKGNYTQQITQIGNAIPPIFITKLFSYILDFFNGNIIEIS